MSWNILVKFLGPFRQSSSEGETRPPQGGAALLYLLTVAVMRWWPEPQKRRLHLGHWQILTWEVLFSVFFFFFQYKIAPCFTILFFPLSPYKRQNYICISNYKVNMTSKKGNCLLPKTWLYYRFFKHEAFNKPYECRISFPSDETLPHGFTHPPLGSQQLPTSVTCPGWCPPPMKPGLFLRKQI